jgi:hypothetical protein
MHVEEEPAGQLASDFRAVGETQRGELCCGERLRRSTMRGTVHGEIGDQRFEPFVRR